MADTSSLKQRIQSEFAASQEKLKKFQTQQVTAHHAKQDRLEQLEKVLDQLRDVWRPRLELLAQQFGERVQATPTITPGRREALFQVQSPVATVRLKVSAAADTEVENLMMSYDLDIMPILMQFERHSELSVPLDKVNPDTIATWLDDRLVSFVQTYLAIHENQYYLKDLMVEDPVAHVKFPKFAAGATRDQGGKTYYFISEETASEFESGH